MRLFFGAPIGESVRERVAELQARLKIVAGKVTWVPPANFHFHFTLRFLGEIPEARVARTAEAAEGVWDSVEPGRVALRGLGAFPSATSPRVIWVAATEGAEILERIEAVLSQALREKLAIAPESRPFVPHLTIGRVRLPRRDAPLEHAIAALADADAGSFAADRFVLYQSVLRSPAPEYRPVQVYESKAEVEP